jgi:hypothetical protein
MGILFHPAFAAVSFPGRDFSARKRIALHDRLVTLGIFVQTHCASCSSMLPTALQFGNPLVHSIDILSPILACFSLISISISRRRRSFASLL